MIEEKLIQFVWQHRLFDSSGLMSINGESIKIVKSGFLNDYDGPDFSDARIFIDEIEWVGAVEIHVHDIDWIKHGHEVDSKYDSVILHVVWEVVGKEARPNNVPCLILKDYVSNELLSTYRDLMSASGQLACDDYLSKINEFDKIVAIEEKSYRRLRRKALISVQKLKTFGGDWQQLLFWMFAMALGKKANKDAMQALAEMVQMKTLQKYGDDLTSIEAIVFGVAGLLDVEDEYGSFLNKEFMFLSHKYNMEVLNHDIWNFSKVRGTSKPHLSIAILSSVVYYIHQLSDLKSIDSLFFEKIQLTEYWQKHMKFGVLSKRKNTISKGLIEHLKINVVVPYLNLLGQYYNDDIYYQRAQDILEGIKPEQNSVITKFVDRTFPISNSYQSQGALELYNEYCSNKKCLDCQVGKKILNQG